MHLFVQPNTFFAAQDTIRTEDLPEAFSWAEQPGGISMVTKNLNQHIPQVQAGLIPHKLRALAFFLCLPTAPRVPPSLTRAWSVTCYHVES